MVAACGLTFAFLITSPTLAQQTFEEWLRQDQAELAEYNAEVTAAYDKFVKEEAEAFAAFIETAGNTWGKGNVWVPEQKMWVQYREDFEERSSVNFGDGRARIQVVVPDNAGTELIAEAIANAVETLVLSGSLDPIEMMRRRLFGRRSSAAPQAKPTPPPRTFVYTVEKGDSIWKVSRKFGISRDALARANDIDPNGWLKIGQRLTIPGKAGNASPAKVPAARRDPRLAAKGTQPLLTRQVRLADGTPVTPDNASDFARHVAASPSSDKRITGSDGRSRRVVSAQFDLVPDHVRIRAERFRPMVTEYAAKYGVYPPLVYAIMHSESSFNPRARSHVPAFGLMQLVPRSGARDAYRYVYKHDKLVSGSYLFNPRNNIELGTAFLYILDQRYFQRVENPTNRMLCSIAAYNTGAGNVCKAFGGTTSLSRATPVINTMQPAEVYARLRSDLPYEETRKYIKKVNDRIPMYKAWR
jgi:soluble lytic murein transglycosylase-like protein